ncbi:pentatricopeptide repeat-containing protein At2g13600-like [Eucalyptus grandis]|uniref:pentatricopeptide repeat-containing protein At2g13600-like n=1 Tax=Eucalyptus grandis TaxID=71139 RepID=UPI00192E9589|nr:pentatricopeptide repeat-containing protein At2g13600-like [Eucalyptus grandis]
MDEFTFVGVVGACARLGAFKFLRQVHGVAIIMGLEFTVITYNSLIDAYGKCGGVDICRALFEVMPEKDIVSWTSMVVAYTQAQNLDDACAIFNNMPVKTTVSWTALISGFVQNGHGDEALDLFLQMHEEGIQPSPHTFVSDLCACADQALGERGKQIHGYIARTCFNKALENIFIWNALIDMYCKCGDMRSAAILFLRMPKRDIVSWNSMITGFAQNGLGHESLVFLKTMLEMNVRPDLISFLGALSACSHTGLDVEALQIFNAMEKDYSLQPRFDHCTILVDLLGRKNRLEEAMGLIESVSNKSKHVGMWGALLGACEVHGNLVIARKAVDALLNLELQNAARYVMLSSINAKLTDGMIPAE